MMNIAGKLRKLRDEKGITQNDLAKIIGICKEEVQKFENIQKPIIPPIDILKKFSQFYKVKMEYLLDDDWNARKYCYVVVLCDKNGEASSFHFTYNNREEAVAMIDIALKEGYELKVDRYSQCTILDDFFDDE